MSEKNYTQQIERNFAKHVVTSGRAIDMDELRSACGELASFIDSKCPDGREKSVALTKLEEVMFWANSAIAREV